MLHNNNLICKLPRLWCKSPIFKWLYDSLLKGGLVFACEWKLSIAVLQALHGDLRMACFVVSPSKLISSWKAVHQASLNPLLNEEPVKVFNL